MSTQPPPPNVGLLHGQGEHPYEQMFRANPLAMWVYDVQTLRFLDVNAAAVALYGYSREEFLSMTIAGIRAPEDVPAMHEQVGRVVALDSFAMPPAWCRRSTSGHASRSRRSARSAGAAAVA